MNPSQVSLTCSLCGRSVPMGGGYVVRINVFADPEMPPTTTQEIENTAFDQSLSQLLQDMEHMTAEELQDGVHRSFEYRLCVGCHAIYLSNPLGLPRKFDVGKN